MIAGKVGASFRYPRRTIHGTIGRMSTPIIALVGALGVIVPLALGFLPSQRKRRATPLIRIEALVGTGPR